MTTNLNLETTSQPKINTHFDHRKLRVIFLFWFPQQKKVLTHHLLLEISNIFFFITLQLTASLLSENTKYISRRETDQSFKSFFCIYSALI